MSEKSAYKEIFKYTFLFSFVKVFQILLGIVRNKVVAVLLGAEGVGIIGILSNAVSLLQTGAGLGLSQSAVRDISVANGSENKTRFSHIITLTNRVILFTCLLGCLVTIVLSPFLSEWTFGDKSYSIAYLWLALVVGLNILSEGQFAILKGMRQLRALAKASMIGSIVGAGGSGFDIISIIHSINNIKKEWRILGYLDDNPALLNKLLMGYRVLGSIEDGQKYSNAFFISSIANPTNRIVRRNIWNRISLYTNKFATIIHPTVITYDDVKIQSGSVINAGCILGSKVEIGFNVHLGYGCNIAHETVLNDHVSLGSGVNLSSGVVVGSDCYIGAGVSSTHDIEIDENILVAVGSSIISNLKRKTFDTWIGTPAVSMKEYVRHQIIINSIIVENKLKKIDSHEKK